MESVSSAGPAQEGFASRMLQTGLLIDKFYTPLLCLLGTLGNSLSLAVFCLDSKYRSQSSSYYLSALAVSDTGFLLNLFAVWLETVHGGVITSSIMCPLVMYLGQVTCFMSVYLTVAFSIERYVAVHYPFSRPRICTRSKAKKVIFSLTAVALLLFSYVWIIAKVVEIKSSSSPRPYRNGSRYCQQLVTANLSFANISAMEDGIGSVQQQGHLLFHEPIKDDEDDDSEYKSTEFPLNLELTFSSEKQEYSKYSMGDDENRMGKGSGTTALIMDSLGQISKLESQNLYGHISGKRSIKEDHENPGDEREPMNRKWDYVSLIDDGIPQERQERLRSDERIVGPILSFGTTAGYDNDKILSAHLPAESQQNFSTHYNSTLVPNPDPYHLSKSERCRNRCTVPIHYHKISEIANYMDTAVTLIVPFLLITYFNVRISLSVWKLKDQRQQIVAPPSIHTNKVTTLVVTDNRPGKHFPLTKVMNNRLLCPSPQSRRNNQHISVTTTDGSSSAKNNDFEGDIDDNNGDCSNWHGSQRKGLCVRFEDSCVSSGACRYTACVAENGTNLTLNEGHKPLLMHTAKPNVRDDNSGDINQAFPTYRQEQRATFHLHHHHSPSSEIKVTKTLLLISTVFLMLNLPLHVLRCTQFIQSVTGTQEGKETLQALQPWANILFNSNFAVNFLLYCASGRNFRNSLKHIASRVLRTPPQSSSANQHRYCDHPPTRQSLGGGNRKWRRQSSTPEKAKARNPIANATATTTAKGTQVTEFLEMGDIVGIGIENGSVYITETGNSGNDESLTV